MRHGVRFVSPPECLRLLLTVCLVREGTPQYDVQGTQTHLTEHLKALTLLSKPLYVSLK